MKKRHEDGLEFDVEALGHTGNFLGLENEAVTVREAHHAMHILTFFAFMMNLAAHQKPIRRAMVDRVIYHLLNLREFIQDARMGDIVSDLCGAMTVSYDDFFPGKTEESQQAYLLSQWIDRHENGILALARHYGKETLFDALIKAA